ncbi:MAG: M48 family metallopeptidase [Magnetococcales bacterium]|nr:M48 family metallopeptidase [Magnetococcales bacterium]
MSKRWLKVDGDPIPYILVRVKSRKKMTVLVNPKGEVEVRVPVRVTISQAEAFLQQCHQWVVNRLSVVERQIQQQPRLLDGAVIPYLGERLKLKVDASHHGGVERKGRTLQIPHRWADDPIQLQKRLELWFRGQARSHFQSRLSHWARQMDVTYNRLTIRGQKTVWGSCSIKNNINLNWRLMWMPYRVADYVVIHELSHLDHMDHSFAFWQRVGQFEPDHLLLRKKLSGFKLPW